MDAYSRVVTGVVDRGDPALVGIRRLRGPTYTQTHGAHAMNTLSNPNTVHTPAGKYHHTVNVPDNSEWLVIAGQVGMDREGKIAGGVREQAEQAFRNIVACLEANGMVREDLVKLTTYLTDPRFIGDYRAARSAVIGDEIQPASTLLIVSGLATPDLLVEIEAWAAKSQS